MTSCSHPHIPQQRYKSAFTVISYIRAVVEIFGGVEVIHALAWSHGVPWTTCRELCILPSKDSIKAPTA